VKPDEIEWVTIHTYWFAWHEIGSEPEKWHPSTRESADHSLPYIIAAVLIDGAFSDSIFSDERIRDPRVHAMADRISVKEDPEFTRRFSAAIPCRLEVRTKRGEVKTAAVEYPRGHYKNPMTDEEVETKFRVLAGRFLPATQVDGALKGLWKIDQENRAGIVFDLLCRR
jgi:2-methylcitrate dehydratase